jgi:glycerophosphoryl diester phosphodiesterase
LPKAPVTVCALAALLLLACKPSIELQGHRGARGLYPENTIEGFVEALAIGVTTLELDTSVTKDGVVVVHHDELLHADTTQGEDGAWITPPTPAIHALTFAELSRYRVGHIKPGSPYAVRFPDQRGLDGVRIPKLSDVLARAEQISEGRIRYNIETKLSPDAPERAPAPKAFADAVVAVVKRAGVTERTTIQSFDWRTLAHIDESAPAIETSCLSAEEEGFDTIERGKPGPSPWTAGLDVDDHAGSVPRLVKAAGCEVWSPGFADIGRTAVDQAHQLGLRVVVWTVNQPADVEAMLDLGVDAIISDYPDRVRAVLEKHGLPLPPPRN